MTDAQVAALVRSAVDEALERHSAGTIQLFKVHRREQERMHLENRGSLAEIRDGLGRMDQILTGKGEPEKGLVSRVKGLEKDVEHHEKNAARSRAWSQAAVLAAVSACFAALGRWIVKN